MLVGGLMIGMTFFLLGSTDNRSLASLVLFFGGLFGGLGGNMIPSTIQSLAPDELRGRVMGVWSMTWFLSAVGGLPASMLTEWIGAPWTVALGALSVSVFAGLMFVLSTELRRLPAPGFPDVVGRQPG